MLWILVATILFLSKMCSPTTDEKFTTDNETTDYKNGISQNVSDQKSRGGIKWNV